MSQLIDRLRDAQDAYAERLHKVLLSYKQNPEALFCVYEGEDGKYYDVRIGALTGFRERETIPCKGKEDVLRLHQRIVNDPNFTGAYVVFFIDKDFDMYRGYNPSRHLYMTPCYSIENLYVTMDVIKHVLRVEFKVHRLADKDEYEEVLSLFESLMNSFLDEVTTLNAWIAVQREENADTSRLNLNNKSIEDFIHIDLESIYKVYDVSVLNDSYTAAVPLTTHTVNEREAKFQPNEKLYTFRGKYLIDFVRLFLMQLKQDCSKPKPKYLHKKRRISFQLSKKNIISELSHYAETPDCLKYFLQNIQPI